MGASCRGLSAAQVKYLHCHGRDDAGVNTRVAHTICVNTAERWWDKLSYRGADKSLARPGRKQARMHVGDARDFNNIEARAVIKFFFFLQGKAPKENDAILTETLACFLPDRAKDLSAPLYVLSME